MTLSLRHLRLTARTWVRRHPRLHVGVRFLKYGFYRGFCDNRVRNGLQAQARREGWLVLNLGSGGRRNPVAINLDVTPVTGPDIVGDGYALPFADGSLDAIFCESVIEHVADPEAFLRAATRALKPGGIWYLEVPFLQPFHAGQDYQRWTRDGFQGALRRAGLEPVAAGTHAGPGFFLAWFLRDLLALMLSLGWPPLRRVLSWVLGFLTGPFLLLDLLLMRLPGCPELACALYHVARRPADPPPP